MKKIFLIILINFYSGVCLKAQTDSTEKSRPQLKFSFNYNSHLNYYGRTDSLRSSGYFPMAEVWFNKSFYIMVAPVFVHNSTASFDYAGTVATGGYQFFSDDKKWFGNFYLVKPFYESNSQLVQSSLKAQTAFSLTNLNRMVNVTAGADAKLSDKMDFGVTGGLDHIFKKQFDDHSMLVVDPSAFLFAGTQQFTNTYYKQNSFLFFPPGAGQRVSENVKKFSVLSYEFSMPVIYAKQKFQLLVTPAYVIPQNLIAIEGRPDLSERGKEMFYTTIGVKLVL